MLTHLHLYRRHPRVAPVYLFTNLVPATSKRELPTFFLRSNCRRAKATLFVLRSGDSFSTLFPFVIFYTFLNLFRAYIPSMLIVRARSIFVMRVLRCHRIFIKKESLKAF